MTVLLRRGRSCCDNELGTRIRAAHRAQVDELSRNINDSMRQLDHRERPWNLTVSPARVRKSFSGIQQTAQTCAPGRRLYATA